MASGFTLLRLFQLFPRRKSHCPGPTENHHRGQIHFLNGRDRKNSLPPCEHRTCRKTLVGLDGFVKLIGTRSNFGRPQLPCQPSSLVEAGNQCIAHTEGCPASNLSPSLNGRAQRKAIKADKNKLTESKGMKRFEFIHCKSNALKQEQGERIAPDFFTSLR